ncbi:hypothetical protein OBA28_02605, partial [Alphaproteobacteria bacterium]|nr:hypothetical protein [Alphaproteobacteria bacterium]
TYMIKKCKFLLLSLMFIFLFFKDKESLSKKVVNVYDKVFECKFPKNSFERMRGVRTRICILDEEDNKIINKIRKKKKNLKR